MPGLREQQRDRIADAIAERIRTFRFPLLLNAHDVKALAGIALAACREERALASELEEARAAIARVRAAANRRRLDEVMPVREVLDALYGEEPR